MSELEKAFEFGINYLGIKDKPRVKFYEGEILIRGNYCHYLNLVSLNSRYWQEGYLETLFHELVHCKQYEQGWLKRCYEKELLYWKKNNTNGKGYDLKTYKEYYNSPHERQARDISKNMLKKFKIMFAI